MIQRISKEKAEGLIKATEDFTDSPVKYFTITPSTSERYTAEDGWEDVSYFLPRRKRMYEGRKGDGDSWVYVLSNESQPGMYKIGYTSHEDVDKRVKQLSRSTSVATPFNLEWAFRCFNAERLEGEVHEALKGHRISKDREFFAISLNEAKETVEDLGQKYI